MQLMQLMYFALKATNATEALQWHTRSWNVKDHPSTAMYSICSYIT